ncbi:MAG: hypothetical protein ACXWUN_01730 [Allosphingosinicella sp.]
MFRIDSLVTRPAARSAAFLSLLLSSWLGILAVAPVATSSAPPPPAARGAPTSVAQAALVPELAGRAAADDDDSSPDADEPLVPGGGIGLPAAQLPRPARFAGASSQIHRPLSAGHGFSARAPPTR